MDVYEWMGRCIGRRVKVCPPFPLSPVVALLIVIVWLQVWGACFSFFSEDRFSDGGKSLCLPPANGMFLLGGEFSFLQKVNGGVLFFLFLRLLAG